MAWLRTLLGLVTLVTLFMVAHPPSVLAFLIDVRSGPGGAYEVVAKVPPGGSYVAVAQQQEWYKIQLPDGREGWIHLQNAGQEDPRAWAAPVDAPTPGMPSRTAPPTASAMPSSAPPPAFTPSRMVEPGIALPMSRRTALVIGNEAYPIAPLQNAGKDATDMAAVLRRLGFDVTFLRDAPLQEMEEAVNAFNLRLRQGGMGLFYFAGHGVQVDGENYLLPVNARIARQQDVRYQTLAMGRVVGAMEDAGNGLNVLILDACRNMPFARSWRSSQVGLAVPPTARGMLIAYATAPGGQAADGAGENGVYTKHLLQAMLSPGLSIEQVFKHVRYEVVAETAGQQIPWESSSLLGDFAFVPAQAGPVPAGVPPYPASASDPETVLWSMSEQSSHPEDVLAFLQAYPESRFAPAARLRLQQFQQQSPPAAEVSVPSVPLPEPAPLPRAVGFPPSPSPSAPLHQPTARVVPPHVSAETRPPEEAERHPAMDRPAPLLSSLGYTLIRRIYCEDVGSRVITSSIDLSATSPLSCAEAKNVLVALEQAKDHCRFPQDDLNVVDEKAQESRSKAKEWIGTPSCHMPS